jgi:hypothetical protein
MTACEKCRLEIGNVEDSICQKCMDDAENELREAEKNYDKAGLEYKQALNVLYIDIEK